MAVNCARVHLRHQVVGKVVEGVVRLTDKSPIVRRRPVQTHRTRPGRSWQGNRPHGRLECMNLSETMVKHNTAVAIGHAHAAADTTERHAERGWGDDGK